MNPTKRDPPLQSLFLRTLWIWQAAVASPIFVILGLLVILNLFNTFDGSIYDFVTRLFSAIMAAAIITLVLVQRQIPREHTEKTFTLRCEIAKSLLGTALWAWCLFDSVNAASTYDSMGVVQNQRVVAAMISIVLLM
ncbi:hypothetical protein EJ03DRAFT_142146 [Teratosphaeria nubilosa]|uniref:Uncharacterized protein n=1 Tax=Teratosphaeria nubilosa TaxID=161662 RepID=A0A6G1L4H5_9PEZI|nr:hypothetical protein EJ03DRAFT_142146 [Teratosphaeria nubilosa]